MTVPATRGDWIKSKSPAAPRFELIKTAKALGLEVPPLLARADEVIE